MNLGIITPDEQLFQGEASSVTVPGSDRLLGILDHHAPLISWLKKGPVKLTAAGVEKNYEVNGGVVEVLNKKVMILAE